MTTNDVGQLIYFLRQQRGLSQLELGRVARVSTTTVWAIEAGQTNPRLETLNKLAQALDTRLSISFEVDDGKQLV